MKHDSIYLISPSTDFPTYYGSECYAALGMPRTGFVADLALTTVAATLPPNWRVRVCDEQISPVDMTAPESVVGITGKTGQVGRMIELGVEFRRRGKLVIIGGPFASLSPEALRPACDVLLQGELEPIADRFWNDIAAGTWSPHYSGTREPLEISPRPRWDLYPNDHAVMGCVQTSRGCPFECEFCDVIQYVGRRQRFKPIDQVINELQLLYTHGYRAIFLSDDNFTVNRRRAYAVLSAMREWNDSNAERVLFTTQVSIDVARDGELLGLAAAAGLIDVFVGIETPNEDSLRETRKRQNVGVDLLGQIDRLVERGIRVTAGMIVGFDCDYDDIFKRQFEFAMASSVPIFTLNLLVAPTATPLYDRMALEGRLRDRDPAGAPAIPWVTNIRAKHLTADQMQSGLHWLLNSLYAPAAFETRMLRMIDTMSRADIELPQAGRRTQASANAMSAAVSIARLGSREATMCKRVMSAAHRTPQTRAAVLYSLDRYRQIRFMLSQGSMWDPVPTERARGTTQLVSIRRKVLSSTGT